MNWHKAAEVGAALLFSPLLGFTLAAAGLALCRLLVPDPELYQPPHDDKPPPRWIRAILILTCGGVSYAHGSNDGQKGMGLVLLVLPGIYLLVALCAAYPVLLEGRLSVPGAIDHALQLVRGHWWRSAGVLAAALFAILIFYSAGHLCGIMLARLASTATVVVQQGLVSVVSALVGCLFMPFVTALGQAHHAALEQSLALSRLPPGALPGAPGAAAR